MVLSNQTQEKVTVVLPKALKDEVVELKEVLQISMNAIYQNAIAQYVAQKKREQLRQEAKMMLEEYRTNPEIQEIAEFGEKLDEY